jgi:hypothetical protein
MLNEDVDRARTDTTSAEQGGLPRTIVSEDGDDVVPVASFETESGNANDLNLVMPGWYEFSPLNFKEWFALQVVMGGIIIVLSILAFFAVNQTSTTTDAFGNSLSFQFCGEASFAQTATTQKACDNAEYVIYNTVIAAVFMMLVGVLAALNAGSDTFNKGLMIFVVVVNHLLAIDIGYVAISAAVAASHYYLSTVALPFLLITLASIVAFIALLAAAHTIRLKLLIAVYPSLRDLSAEAYSMRDLRGQTQSRQSTVTIIFKCALLFFSFLLMTVAVSTAHWDNFEDDDLPGAASFHMGLWEACQDGYQCRAVAADCGLDTGFSASVTSFLSVTHLPKCGQFNAMRIMVALSVVFLFVDIIFMIIDIVKRRNNMLIQLIFTLLACLSAGVALVLFVDYYENDWTESSVTSSVGRYPVDFDKPFGWSAHLYAVGFISAAMYMFHLLFIARYNAKGLGKVNNEKNGMRASRFNTFWMLGIVVLQIVGVATRRYSRLVYGQVEQHFGFFEYCLSLSNVLVNCDTISWSDCAATVPSDVSNSNVNTFHVPQCDTFNALRVISFVWLAFSIASCVLVFIAYYKHKSFITRLWRNIYLAVLGCATVMGVICVLFGMHVIISDFGDRDLADLSGYGMGFWFGTVAASLLVLTFSRRLVLSLGITWCQWCVRNTD